MHEDDVIHIRDLYDNLEVALASVKQLENILQSVINSRRKKEKTNARISSDNG
jgi:hypothetical protein